MGYPGPGLRYLTSLSLSFLVYTPRPGPGVSTERALGPESLIFLKVQPTCLAPCHPSQPSSEQLSSLSLHTGSCSHGVCRGPGGETEAQRVLRSQAAILTVAQALFSRRGSLRCCFLTPIAALSSHNQLHDQRQLSRLISTSQPVDHHL